MARHGTALYCAAAWYRVRAASLVNEPAVATALHPTVGTVRPSAMLAVVGVKTGAPFFSALIKLGHRSGSTP